MSRGGCYCIDNVNDGGEFANTDTALGVRVPPITIDRHSLVLFWFWVRLQMMNFTPDIREGIYRVMSAILALSNVTVRCHFPIPLTAIAVTDRTVVFVVVCVVCSSLELTRPHSQLTASLGSTVLLTCCKGTAALCSSCCCQHEV